ncbi:hypothetical protein BGP89_01255 [Luteimonas sp. JM171]|uniref:hypothetical protein n=1 Tax=Luteimonas sp. JM171 TaxID=1896164 RepID=UPI000855A6B5|nr:hypothetical protein [Luteimonas sp. JM171]AOH35153.1 hypothetical protein BGP89_01255 [Luteimonas sp. JM171]
MIRALLFTLVLTATPDASHANPPADQDAAQARVELPARFVANRVVLVPTTVDGRRLALMTDTGHPEWRVIQGAQAGTGSDMIEVPEVEIAGFTVGPVWFTHRPDAAFHDMMSSMMDQRVEGAIGGNAFRHFVMTVDYPRAVAYFRCAAGCGSRPAATAKPPPGP